MFYIYAPHYVQNSNGIRICYLLVELLRSNGLEAKALCYTDRRSDIELPRAIAESTVFLSETKLDLDEADVIVYPETISRNPLNGKRVVRYLLNRPSYLTNECVEYSETDFLVAYSKSIDDKLPQLYLLINEADTIKKYKQLEKENAVCLYFGKVDEASLVGKVKRFSPLLRQFKKINVITRVIPTSRDELFATIARSRLLICFDPISNISYESTLLGTPVVMADSSFGTDGAFNIPLWGISSSVADIDRIGREVGRAYPYYEQHLNTQSIEVRNWASIVERHFRLIHSIKDEEYLLSNRRLILSQQATDQARSAAALKLRPLENIDYHADIPKKVLKMIGHREYYMPKRHRVGLKGKTSNILKRLRIYPFFHPIYLLIKALIR